MKKILLISCEAYPKVKVGGLGKVTDGLKKGLEKNGVEVKVVVPDKNIYTPLFKKETEKNNRVLGKMAADLCANDNWQPDWVSVHDWGGIWSADEFKKNYSKSKIVWTVHSPIKLDSNYSNYGYGYGYGYETDNQNENIDWGDSFFDFSALINNGINVSDKITTVSKSFSRSLKRSFLFERAKEIEGINNGLDLREWSAFSDKLIYKKLITTSKWGEFKSINKRKIQQYFELEINKDIPVFCFVSRLVKQKGLDLLLEVMPKFLSNNDVQVIFLGSGEKSLTKKINNLQKKFSSKVGCKLEADFELPHQLYAGSDFLMLPSISEPYGLVVAEAKRYGVIPIVHLVDGLKDQVEDGKNGFGFQSFNSLEMERKLVEAVKSYKSSWHYRTGISLINQGNDWNRVASEWTNCLYGK